MKSIGDFNTLSHCALSLDNSLLLISRQMVADHEDLKKKVAGVFTEMHKICNRFAADCHNAEKWTSLSAEERSFYSTAAHFLGGQISALKEVKARPVVFGRGKAANGILTAGEIERLSKSYEVLAEQLTAAYTKAASLCEEYYNSCRSTQNLPGVSKKEVTARLYVSKELEMHFHSLVPGY